MPSKAAVIDIGSNSIRYLGRGGEKRLITTRLAESIVETGRLSDAAIARSIDAQYRRAQLLRFSCRGGRA